MRIVHMECQLVMRSGSACNRVSRTESYLCWAVSASWLVMRFVGRLNSVTSASSHATAQINVNSVSSFHVPVCMLSNPLTSATDAHSSLSHAISDTNA